MTSSRDALEARARHAIARLSIIAEASAPSLDGKTASSKPGSKPPPWPGQPAHAHHLHAIRQAWHSTRRLQDAVTAAEAELDAICYSSRRADNTTNEGRLEIATHPAPAATIARIYGVTVRHVYTCREWARRHGITT